MDYEKLYHDLFNAVTDTIENLKEAQLKAEENYIKMTEDDDKKINILYLTILLIIFLPQKWNTIIWHSRNIIE